MGGGRRQNLLAPRARTQFVRISATKQRLRSTDLALYFCRRAVLPALGALFPGLVKHLLHRELARDLQHEKDSGPRGSHARLPAQCMIKTALGTACTFTPLTRPPDNAATMCCCLALPSTPFAAAKAALDATAFLPPMDLPALLLFLPPIAQPVFTPYLCARHAGPCSPLKSETKVSATVVSPARALMQSGKEARHSINQQTSVKPDKHQSPVRAIMNLRAASSLLVRCFFRSDCIPHCVKQHRCTIPVVSVPKNSPTLRRTEVSSG